MRHPAAFINVIAEGRNFDEALKWLQTIWDELIEANEEIENLKTQIATGSAILSDRK